MAPWNMEPNVICKCYVFMNTKTIAGDRPILKTYDARRWLHFRAEFGEEIEHKLSMAAAMIGDQELTQVHL